MTGRALGHPSGIGGTPSPSVTRSPPLFAPSLASGLCSYLGLKAPRGAHVPPHCPQGPALADEPQASGNPRWPLAPAALSSSFPRQLKSQRNTQGTDGAPWALGRVTNPAPRSWEPSVPGETWVRVAARETGLPALRPRLMRGVPSDSPGLPPTRTFSVSLDLKKEKQKVPEVTRPVSGEPGRSQGSHVPGRPCQIVSGRPRPCVCARTRAC